MPQTAISQQDFYEQVVARYTDVVGAKLGGSVVGFSNEWFAEASNLIQPKAPIRDATKFVYSGAWYDGWETRRHNTEEADWVLLKFGVSSAQLIGAEVDTAFFNGNHAPLITVEAATVIGDGSDVDWSAVQWDMVIGKEECGPSRRHFFKRDALTEKSYTHARLKQYPDGGIARFRLYGKVNPNLSEIQAGALVDLASVGYGGVAVRWSDQHFGSADNLLLPGRGVDMSDGWETKRSRTAGHVDWVIIKLGAQCKIQKVVVDTAHFRGNFPQKVSLHGLLTDEEAPEKENGNWRVLMSPARTGADKEHHFEEELGNLENVYSHVLLTIIPDGGVKRVRVFGRPV